ncbi:EAL domain-containing protein [Rhodovulum sp. DZ06]|uniref:EAL domain-containing protein n=1 Tax=Rhodovulum sp. DZ06 TaxID=3425126 RepID=UPI003D32825A
MFEMDGAAGAKGAGGVELFSDKDDAPGGVELFGGGGDAPGGVELFGGGGDAPGGVELFGGDDDAPGGVELFGGGGDAPGGVELFGGGDDAPGGVELFGGGDDAPGGVELFGGPAPAPAAPKARALKQGRLAEQGGHVFAKPMSFAFQPIWDLREDRLFGHEALLRTACGDGPETLFAALTPDTIHHFDQRCRTEAIEAAAELGLPGRLSINFLPEAVHDPYRDLQSSLMALGAAGRGAESLIFEAVGRSRSEDPLRLRIIRDVHHEMGLLFSLDDFGGAAPIHLAADLLPDIVKLASPLTRGADRDPGRRRMIRGIVEICADLGITVAAKRLERREEVEAAAECGVELVQGIAVAAVAGSRPDAEDDIRARLARQAA